MNATTFARIAAAAVIAGIMALGAQTATASIAHPTIAVVADSATTTPGPINVNSDPWD